MIKSLQNLINSLSDQLQDAKDELFSEIDYQPFSKECEMFVQIQNEVKNGKKKCKQLKKRIKYCKIQEKLMRKELNEMNLRIEENERYKIELIRRKEKADKSALYWQNRIAQKQSNNATTNNSNNCNNDNSNNNSNNNHDNSDNSNNNSNDNHDNSDNNLLTQSKV
ncbi:Uncharacterized protein BM_BM17780 [Brugia malayi]|uniref:Uncharacterized protein n=1 Tax=Brugia malayi TaxID=6279 RepID=A0A4E9FR96_BRUMA|nr:Uncharacterized protein BM_BM17780 [Brugia malayi]VIO99062.1 Uncharacterized protein BM_BM17780 [Brugia malayi]